MKKFFRKAHRWLGLLMAIQICAWMVSGLYFAWSPIETIRGEHLVAQAATFSPRSFDEFITPGQAWQVASMALTGPVDVETLTVVLVDSKPWYRFRGSAGGERFTRQVSAVDGEMMPMLEAQTAQRLALNSLAVEAEVASVTWVDQASAGSEYRGRQLPLWRVSFAEPVALNVYVDAQTGDVVARRTTRWRIFDFLWMLHIMDFSERDDFNTPLLQIAAALGLLLALSGLVYWGMTTRLFRSNKKIS